MHEDEAIKAKRRDTLRMSLERAAVAALADSVVTPKAPSFRDELKGGVAAPVKPGALCRAQAQRSRRDREAAQRFTEALKKMPKKGSQVNHDKH